jgi:hypothetical protein
MEKTLYTDTIGKKVIMGYITTLKNEELNSLRLIILKIMRNRKLGQKNPIKQVNGINTPIIEKNVLNDKKTGL